VSTTLRAWDKLRIVIEILALYARARRDLRRGGLAGSLGSMPRPAERDHQRALAQRLGRAVNRTLSALPWDPPCLVRAVVLARMLARRNVGSKVVLGVQLKRDFTAHAWVEHRGLPLLPAGDYGRGRLAEF
jgi:hypothetical protein